MPRPRGPHSDNVSQALAVRMPLALLERVYRAAGLEPQYTEKGKIAPGGSQLAEWFRNLVRRGVGVPLDFDAGFEEGKMQGWAASQAELRSSLKGFYGAGE